MTWTRSFFAALLLLGLAGTAAADTNEILRASWEVYRERHIMPDGRVVDDGNESISHSEGQGYAMLLAAELDQPALFARLWSWTRNNLLIRDDGLAAWRYDPGEAPPITDINNATDGDLLIAHALVLAGRKWERLDYLEEGRLLAERIRQNLIVTAGDYTLLLPGAAGFADKTGYVINPSYWIFHSLTELRQADPDLQWEELYETGMRLLQELAERYRAIPDWVAISHAGELSPPEDFEWVSGYNALRVPLYLRLAGEEDAAIFLAFQEHWNDTSAGFPVVRGLPDHEVLGLSEDPGFLALRSLLICDGSGSLAPLSEESFYYPATLLLFIHLVWARELTEC